MQLNHLAIAIAILVKGATLHAAECEVSLPNGDDLPDWSSEVPEGFIWVGSPRLAARVPESGAWTGMGLQHNYFDKWWWWREGYRAVEEPEPELVITATRLDASSPPVSISDTTSALGRYWDLMLVGMEFPRAGCWEVVGRYHSHELRFVFKVGE